MPILKGTSLVVEDLARKNNIAARAITADVTLPNASNNAWVNVLAISAVTGSSGVRLYGSVIQADQYVRGALQVIEYRLIRGSTVVLEEQRVSRQSSNRSTKPKDFFTVDVPSAGTHTYQIQARARYISPVVRPRNPTTFESFSFEAVSILQWSRVPNATYYNLWEKEKEDDDSEYRFVGRISGTRAYLSSSSTALARIVGRPSFGGGDRINSGEFGTARLVAVNSAGPAVGYVYTDFGHYDDTEIDNFSHSSALAGSTFLSVAFEDTAAAGRLPEIDLANSTINAGDVAAIEEDGGTIEWASGGIRVTWERGADITRRVNVVTAVRHPSLSGIYQTESDSFELIISPTS